MRCALVEDNEFQAKLVHAWLEGSGHECDCYPNAHDFMCAIKGEQYDLLMLDWLLPDMSGLEVLRWMRGSVDRHIPVLFITGMDREEDVVTALGAGADDYMIKPARQGELLARVGALMRRTTTAAVDEDVWKFPPYEIRQNDGVIEREGSPVSLTKLEYDLACFLFLNVGRLLSRDNLLQSVWGRTPKVNTRTVDTHISHIRNKLKIRPEHGWRLSSIYQHGYRLERVSG